MIPFYEPEGQVFDTQPLVGAFARGQAQRQQIEARAALQKQRQEEANQKQMFDLLNRKGQDAGIFSPMAAQARQAATEAVLAEYSKPNPNRLAASAAVSKYTNIDQQAYERNKQFNMGLRQLNADPYYNEQGATKASAIILTTDPRTGEPRESPKFDEVPDLVERIGAHPLSFKNTAYNKDFADALKFSTNEDVKFGKNYTIQKSVTSPFLQRDANNQPTGKFEITKNVIDAYLNADPRAANFINYQAQQNGTTPEEEVKKQLMQFAWVRENQEARQVRKPSGSSAAQSAVTFSRSGAQQVFLMPSDDVEADPKNPKKDYKPTEALMTGSFAINTTKNGKTEPFTGVFAIPDGKTISVDGNGKWKKNVLPESQRNFTPAITESYIQSPYNHPELGITNRTPLTTAQVNLLKSRGYAKDLRVNLFSVGTVPIQQSVREVGASGGSLFPSLSASPSGAADGQTSFRETFTTKTKQVRVPITQSTLGILQGIPGGIEQANKLVEDVSRKYGIRGFAATPQAAPAPPQPPAAQPATAQPKPSRSAVSATQSKLGSIKWE